MGGEGAALEALRAIDGLAPVIGRVDHVDVRRVRGRVSLRRFVCGLFGRRPAWLKGLYRLRRVLAWLLGLRQTTGFADDLRPETVPMGPGQRLAFFTVLAAEEDRYWTAFAADRHLHAVLAVLASPLPGGDTAFDVVTVVSYRHWTGPVYFNLVRPFHHLVLWRMANRAAHGETAKGRQDSEGL